MDIEELKAMIPSETVRQYVLDTGWTFTDMQRAALLYHSGLPSKEISLGLGLIILALVLDSQNVDMASVLVLFEGLKPLFFEAQVLRDLFSQVKQKTMASLKPLSNTGERLWSGIRILRNSHPTTRMSRSGHSSLVLSRTIRSQEHCCSSSRPL